MNLVSTKAVLILAGLLLLSVAGNVLLARTYWQAVQKNADAGVLAKVSAERDGLKQAAAVNHAIADEKALDTTALLATLDTIAQRGQQVRYVYRSAAKASPLAASCVPGQARVDAVDAGLGPQTPMQPPVSDKAGGPAASAPPAPPKRAAWWHFGSKKP